jgi:hypothetical protein
LSLNQEWLYPAKSAKLYGFALFLFSRPSPLPETGEFKSYPSSEKKFIAMIVFSKSFRIS